MLPFLLAATLATTQIDTVINSTPIQTIQDRDVRFGVKETVEELLYDKGINPLTSHISVEITKIESPQQKLNIVGMQWLRKNYIVEVKITIDGKEYVGDAKRKTLLFAALLDVENNEVPLNRKAFSKALQRSLEDALKTL
jgi:hypothetical protein